MMLKEPKQIENFEDLPKELQDVEILRGIYRKSITVAGIFGASAGIGGCQVYQATVKIPSTPEARRDDQAVAAGTLTLAALFILGACASIKCRKLIRQGEDILRRNDHNPSPSP